MPLARALAGAGRSVALAEREHLGGSCVNWGCTPSKAMIASSRLAAQARRASEWGIRIPQVEVDFAAVMDRARGMVEGARGELEKSLAAEGNLRLVRGHARLDGREGERFRLRVRRGGAARAASGARHRHPQRPAADRGAGRPAARQV